MNFFYKLAAIIYRSYDDRGVDIPHFRALITIVLILFLHAVHISLIFSLPSNYLMPWDLTASKTTQWVFGFLYFGTIIAIIAIVLRKSKLDKVILTQKQIDRGRAILPLYLTMCIILLLILLIRLGIKKGSI